MPPQKENFVVFQALVVKIGNCQPPKAAVPIVEKEVKIYTLDDVRKFKVEEARIIAQEAAKKPDTSPSESSLAAQHRASAQRAYKKHHPTELMGTFSTENVLFYVFSNREMLENLLNL